jgi:hypothetical protein
MNNVDVENQRIGVENMVEVSLPQQDNFLKVKETLTRIGVASSSKKELFQSAHILHKRGKYYIVHFKELFMLDGKPTNFSEEDRARRNTIVNLLAEWDLVKIIDPDRTKDPICPLSKIKVLSFKEKDEYVLTPKYNIGKRKRTEEVTLT